MAVAVPELWARQCAEAICLRHGVKLVDCIMWACKGDHIVPPQVILEVGINPRALEGTITAVSRSIEGQLQIMSLSPENAHRFSGSEDLKEASLYIELVTRIALSAILLQHQLQQANQFAQSDGKTHTSAVNVDEDNAEEDEASAKQRAVTEMHEVAARTYVKGLLYAFQAFQEVHMMDRRHYNRGINQRGNRGGLHAQSRDAGSPTPTGQKRQSAGTVGWDTIVLLHLVQLVRSAAQGVVDLGENTLGDTLRSWRKLLIYLQSADADVPAEHARRRGALAVVNGLLLLLFQNGNMHQCRILLNSVEQSEKLAVSTRDATKSIIAPAQHMIAEIVKYRYCQGRMRLYERKYAEAFNAFQTAYNMLPPFADLQGAVEKPTMRLARQAQRNNKLRVLFYMITSGLCMGCTPPPAVLNADSVVSQLFQPLYTAIQRGDAPAYNRALEENGALFRQRGVYLTLLHAKVLCFRALLQRAHATLHAIGEDSSRVPISVLVALYNEVIDCSAGPQSDTKSSALGVLQEGGRGKQGKEKTLPEDQPSAVTSEVAELPNDVKELNTMNADVMLMRIAKLVSSGFVRGYLSYEHATLVLSKKDPFPTPN